MKNTGLYLCKTKLYFLILLAESAFFKLSKTDGMMSVITPLDREADSEYSLVIVASNDCDNKPTSLGDFEAKSKLNLQITVMYLYWSINCRPIASRQQKSLLSKKFQTFSTHVYSTV